MLVTAYIYVYICPNSSNSSPLHPPPCPPRGLRSSLPLALLMPTPLLGACLAFLGVRLALLVEDLTFLHGPSVLRLLLVLVPAGTPASRRNASRNARDASRNVWDASRNARTRINKFRRTLEASMIEHLREPSRENQSRKHCPSSSESPEDQKGRNGRGGGMTHSP